MNKSDLFLALLTSASALVPGGAEVRSGITALVKRDDDPTNDVDEIAAAIADIVVGAVKIAEGVKEKDYVNDAALVELVGNLKRDIKLIQQVVIRPAA